MQLQFEDDLEITKMFSGDASVCPSQRHVPQGQCSGQDAGSGERYENIS